MMVHIISLVLGIVLDFIIGDPEWMIFHPIRMMGSAIGMLEKRLNKTQHSEAALIRRGAFMVGIMIVGTICAMTAILKIAFWVHPWVGVIVEAVLCSQMISTKCLKEESLKVYKALQKNDLEDARYKVSRIVGRDTEQLDEAGVIKATVETIAENTADGSIAPLLYMFIGGPVLGAVYKVINTMDSMVGYKNERYYYFGRVAAKTDDLVNYIPARLAAYCMMGACVILGYDVERTYCIYKRDRMNHASPNSAHTEAVCAGALRIQLAGDAMYFGKIIKKPTIGDDYRSVEKEDIERTNNMMYIAVISFALVGIVLKLIVHWIF
ncbi:MAG: adenosylcobinamide-phosphate synthase CbiB [Cellulosilyticaceae bacterium]